MIRTEKETFRAKIINENEYCNIVAKQRGVITKITADTGTAVVKVGDIVEKGDILIGGYMQGKYTSARYVHAKGKVKAKVWYTKKATSGFTREISEKTGNQNSLYQVMSGDVDIKKCIYDTKLENLKIIPSHVNLVGAEVEMVQLENREMFMKNVLEQIRDEFDYIFIDCPPSLRTYNFKCICCIK